MKKILFACALIGLVAIAACVPSIHGLCTPDTTVFEPRLLGFWSDADGEESWRFTRRGDDGYRVLFIEEDGKTLRFTGQLAGVKDRLFLDLYPDKKSLPRDCFAVPAHIFLLVRQIEPELRLAAMDPSRMKKIVAADRSAVKHELVEDGVLLTAGPKELQEFLVRHAEDDALFEDLETMKRWVPLGGDRSILKRIERDTRAAPALRETIGVSLSVVESYFRRSITSTKTPYGFRVAEVVAGTPAARAGWKAGDILLTFGGKPIKSVAELVAWVEGTEARSEVPVTISRRKTDVTLFSRDPWEEIETTITLE